MRGFKYKKAVQALTFFANKSDKELNKMKALKLIWLSDRLHLRKYGRTITGDDYYALPYGPVASSTRDLLEESMMLSQDEKDYSDSYIESVTKYLYTAKTVFNKRVFSETDLEVLECIYDTYSKYPKFDLSSLSHEFPEWKKFESALKQKLASRYLMDFNDFFKNYDDGEGLFNDNQEYLEISKEIHNKKL